MKAAVPAFQPPSVTVKRGRTRPDMLTERLSEFLATWCDMDADTDEVTTILRESPADGFSVWLNHVRETIRTQALTPALARRLTGLRFATQDDVDQWLNRLWSAWFPNEPLPGGRA